jgi:rSAM/selenodomain-associated transferase 1
VERVILFSKAPSLNDVKTRLVPPLLAEQALLLHRAMLGDQIAFVRKLAAVDRECEICLDRPLDPSDDLAASLHGVPVALQGGGDLGARMERALARAFEGKIERAAILGADAPTLPRALVEEVFAHLRSGADAAVIPSADGGYVLVGASRPVPALFGGIPWGTPSVCAATRERAVAAGIRLEAIGPWSDVDVPADLPRLAAELTADPTRAPATSAVMEQLGLYVPRNRVV